jgi:hypothetical protein
VFLSITPVARATAGLPRSWRWHNHQTPDAKRCRMRHLSFEQPELKRSRHHVMILPQGSDIPVATRRLERGDVMDAGHIWPAHGLAREDCCGPPSDRRPGIPARQASRGTSRAHESMILREAMRTVETPHRRPERVSAKCAR